MKTDLEDSKLAKIGCFQKGSNFKGLYDVDYSRLLDGSQLYREKYKGLYKIGRLYRMIERIPRTKLNISVFEKGMGELSNVRASLTLRPIPTFNASMSGSMMAPTSTLSQTCPRSDSTRSSVKPRTTARRRSP